MCIRDSNMIGSRFKPRHYKGRLLANESSADNDIRIKLEISNASVQLPSNLELSDSGDVLYDLRLKVKSYNPFTTPPSGCLQSQIVEVSIHKTAAIAPTLNQQTQTYSAGIPINNLPNEIVVQIPLTTPLPALDFLRNTGQDHACKFFNESSRSWESKGCRVINVSLDSITCGCNHLTNFVADFNIPIPLTPEKSCWGPTRTLMLYTMLFLIVAFSVGIYLTSRRDGPLAASWEEYTDKLTLSNSKVVLIPDEKSVMTLLSTGASNQSIKIKRPSKNAILPSDSISKNNDDLFVEDHKDSVELDGESSPTALRKQNHNNVDEHFETGMPTPSEVTGLRRPSKEQSLIKLNKTYGKSEATSPAMSHARSPSAVTNNDYDHAALTGNKKDLEESGRSPTLSPLENYSRRITKNFFANLIRDLMITGNRADLIFSSSDRLIVHTATIFSLMGITYFVRRDSHMVCGEDCDGIEAVFRLLRDRMRVFDFAQDIGLAFATLVCTLPITITLSLLLKRLELWETEQSSTSIAKYKSQEIFQKRVGLIIALVISLPSCVFVGAISFFDACAENQTDIVDWFFPFALCYVLEMFISDPLKQCFKQLIVVVSAKIFGNHKSSKILASN
eukprot:TRINITY_DN9190_c0_g1_i3.p1 TRINITY_DN9190_c0_g1~~TRINITY_DN9190_c0_g1_i3.p1  ORF type:complete len:639 (-),score=63.04 TRINITY_DN9190_c0_g1_i3:99-1955(-)